MVLVNIVYKLNISFNINTETLKKVILGILRLKLLKENIFWFDKTRLSLETPHFVGSHHPLVSHLAFVLS